MNWNITFLILVSFFLCIDLYVMYVSAEPKSSPHVVDTE